MILIHKYTTSESNCILISIKSAIQKEALEDFFASLASGDRSERDLCQLTNVDAKGIDEIRCKVVTGKRDPAIALRLSEEGCIRADWSLTKEGWTDQQFLLKGLREGTHQYLTAQGVDDALLWVSFSEADLVQ